MARGSHKKELVLQELINSARASNIEVRTEKLLREVGYHVRSGRCRVRGKNLILIDRDASLGEQVEFLAAQLDELGLSRSQPAGTQKRRERVR